MLNDTTWIYTPSPPAPEGSNDLATRTSPPAKRLRSSSCSEAPGHEMAVIAEDQEEALPMTVEEPGRNGQQQQQQQQKKEGHASIKDSLVMVSFDAPHIICGSSSGEFQGGGIVFDKQNGKCSKAARGLSMNSPLF